MWASDAVPPLMRRRVAAAAAVRPTIIVPIHRAPVRGRPLSV